MSINPPDLPLLIGEAKARPFGGVLLTLGRQEVSITGERLRGVAERLSFDLADVGTGAEGKAGDALLSDLDLFRALGFSHIDSMDYAGYEGATILHDLNDPEPPEELVDRFDVIFDRGTSEHVFHLPNLMSSLVKMTKVGGRIIHFSPSSNHIDHGFYMFSPTLFHDYYQANGFEVETMLLVRQPWLERHPRVEVFDYTPGCLGPVSHGGLDAAGYQLFFVVTKRPDSTFGRIPQQSFYVGEWEQTDAGARDTPTPEGRGLLAGLKSALRSNLFLYRLAAALVSPLKKRRLRARSLRRVMRFCVDSW